MLYISGFFYHTMFFRYNLPGFLWGLLILILIGLPGKDIPDMSLWSLLTPDKVFHSVIFGIFVLLLIIGFTKQHSFIYLYYHAKSTAVVSGVLYGGITELLQMVVFTDRTADIMDFTANAIGSCFGLVVFYIIYGRKK